MSRNIFIVLCLGLTIILTGCGIQSVSNSWKRTKKFYGNYINKPACINYSDTDKLDEKDVILASRMMGIDTQLEALQRYLQNSDKPPSDESIIALLNTFPWLSGVVLIEPNGELIAQEPENLLEKSDLAKIIEAKPRGKMLRDIRAAVQETSIGPKAFFSVPVYVDSDMKALFVVYFDIEKLSLYSPYSNALVIFSPEAVLWSGQFSFEDTPLAKQNWESLLKSSVSGKVSNQNGEFFWLSHFIGNQEIVFATPVSGKFFEETNQCFLVDLQENTAIEAQNTLLENSENP